MRIQKDQKDEMFFLTFTVINWIDIFTSEDYYKCLLLPLKYYQNSLNLNVYAYVFMLNHIHLIISADNTIDFVRNYKVITTREICKLIDSDNRKYLKQLFQNTNNIYKIWQDNNSPKIIESDYYMNQKIDYIHNNPVVKGFVEKPEDWIYSSARNYYLGDETLIKVSMNN